MRTFDELLKEQEEIKRVLDLLEEILAPPVMDIKELFKIAERLKKREYFVIYVLHEGLWDGRKYTYSEIGRLLGKKRVVVRKKFLLALRILEEAACTSTRYGTLI